MEAPKATKSTNNHHLVGENRCELVDIADDGVLPFLNEEESEGELKREVTIFKMKGFWEQYVRVNRLRIWLSLSYRS